MIDGAYDNVICLHEGMPARISTSRFSMTRPLNVSVSLSCVNAILVSPTMDNGDDPSAW